MCHHFLSVSVKILWRLAKVEKTTILEECSRYYSKIWEGPGRLRDIIMHFPLKYISSISNAFVC